MAVKEIKDTKDSKDIEDNYKELITPVNDSTTKYPTKFMEIYRKYIRGGFHSTNKVAEKKESLKNSIFTLNNVNLDDDSLLLNDININENEKEKKC